MNNLCRLLQNLKENPVPYIDKPSLINLDSFLTGYSGAEFDLIIAGEGFAGEGSRLTRRLDGFHEWMQERAKASASHSWFGLILFLSRSDRSAFYNFFELFEEFLKEKETLKSQNNEDEENFISNIDKSKLRAFDIYDELLKNVKKRPGMYLGTSSITRLDMLLRGHTLARTEADAPPTEPERNFIGFQSWIEEKYNIYSGQSWAKIILFFSMNESEALDKFFELYEEYLNQQVE